MTRHNCRSDCRKFGKRQTRQRYQCTQCRKVFTEAHDQTLDGMYVPIDKAELVVSLLLEGSSISTVERVTAVHHTTILKLLVLALGAYLNRCAAHRHGSWHQRSCVERARITGGRLIGGFPFWPRPPSKPIDQKLVDYRRGLIWLGFSSAW